MAPRPTITINLCYNETHSYNDKGKQSAMTMNVGSTMTAAVGYNDSHSYNDKRSQGAMTMRFYKKKFTTSLF